ncbi:hypothetical protein Sjap_018718 [Stephania japonica]|uniref:Plant bHLH transcription factor ACT-like domain-containing protein n=1 Tax=Stephania japonica TaxID=461633 RepID=A0AAP0I8R6_9MAGN
MDKASVLGDAIKYMKQLQEKVDALEDKLAKKSTPLPEIEVRVCGKNVLIRIHCDKNKCVLVNALSLLEDNLKLTVTNSNLMPFADSSLHITIVA